jgi:DNA-binding CsgD family transcriptional regulator
MLENLTVRERELFDLLLTGVPPKEIAHKLNISYFTVDFHRKNLYNKLGIHNIQELFAKYSTNGKTPPPEALEAEAIAPVSPAPKKKKKLKVLLPFGIAFLAFSVVFILIMAPDKMTTAHQKGVVIPINNMGFYATSDSNIGGNSTSEVFITREEIDGVSIDILNLKINLIDKDGDVFTSACTNKPDIIQQLRRANGIRFKTRGDGKTWAVQLQTAETTAERNYASYSYIMGTTRDQVIVVDIPYSGLFLPEWYEKYPFDFNKETIRTLLITANRIHGYGTSSIQIFDFEIY